MARALYGPEEIIFFETAIEILGAIEDKLSFGRTTYGIKV